METNQLLEKLAFIVHFWEERNGDAKDEARNSAAWNFYKGQEEMATRMLTLIEESGKIEEVYNNIQSLYIR